MGSIDYAGISCFCLYPLTRPSNCGGDINFAVLRVFLLARGARDKILNILHGNEVGMVPGNESDVTNFNMARGRRENRAVSVWLFVRWSVCNQETVEYNKFNSRSPYRGIEVVVLFYFLSKKDRLYTIMWFDICRASWSNVTILRLGKLTSAIRQNGLLGKKITKVDYRTTRARECHSIARYPSVNHMFLSHKVSHVLRSITRYHTCSPGLTVPHYC